MPTVFFQNREPAEMRARQLSRQDCNTYAVLHNPELLKPFVIMPVKPGTYSDLFAASMERVAVYHDGQSATEETLPTLQSATDATTDARNAALRSKGFIR